MATETQPVRYEDIAGVRSRISWGAIIGGSVMAIACSLVLTFFFAAVGFSLQDADVRSDTIKYGALTAAIVTIATSLFVGGWVATQLTAGETRAEATLYGIITWAVVIGFSLYMAGMGMRTGYFALVSGTMMAENSPAVQQRSADDIMRSWGLNEGAIASVKAQADPAKIRAEMNDPANREHARQVSVVAAWSAVGALLLSIALAIVGALVGCGPSFRVFPVTTRRQEILIAR